MSSQGNNNSNNNVHPPKMSPEDQMKVMHLLKQYQHAQKTKHSRFWWLRVIITPFAKMLKLVGIISTGIDGFIKFVITPKGTSSNPVIQYARGPIFFGVWVMIIFVVGGGTWSATAPLDSAAHARAVVISDMENKIIQHLEGGTIKHIYVRQGDLVNAGDILIELDDARVKPQFEIALNQYRAFLANYARLVAEIEQKDEIEFPKELTDNINDPQVSQLIANQKNIFHTQKRLVESLIIQFEKDIELCSKNIELLKKQVEFDQEQINNHKGLLSQGFVSKVTLDELELRAEKNMHEIIRNETEIAKARTRISETKAKHLNGSLTELKDVRTHMIDAQEKYYLTSESMKKLLITSPIDGIVKALDVNTKGGVIGPGYKIMEITPANDKLVLKASILPANIDSIRVGLVAKVRFTAFKSRTTPVFNGTVVVVSPDTVIDPQTPAQFSNPAAGDRVYVAKIELDMDEFNKVAQAQNLSLVPGMQADVQIVTGTRTLLRYLLDPITDNMFRAFKEK